MTTMPTRLHISFVCTGNICRSPLAHNVLENKLIRANLQHGVTVSSSGTYGHSGWPVDHRSIHVATEAGYKGIDSQRGRCLSQEDYQSCDLLLALDTSHYRFMRQHAGVTQNHKIRYLQQYENPKFTKPSELDVPDPYYDEMDAFKDVLRMIEKSTDGLLEAVRVALASEDPPHTLRAYVPQL